MACNRSVDYVSFYIRQLLFICYIMSFILHLKRNIIWKKVSKNFGFMFTLNLGLNCTISHVLFY